jgi:hypothetical protein
VVAPAVLEERQVVIPREAVEAPLVIPETVVTEAGPQATEVAAQVE